MPSPEIKMMYTYNALANLIYQLDLEHHRSTLDMLSVLVDVGVEQRGFSPGKSSGYNFRVAGIVGLKNRIVCDPAIPDSEPYFVVAGRMSYILCDDSYKYFITIKNGEGTWKDFTTGDRVIIGDAIEKYVKEMDQK